MHRLLLISLIACVANAAALPVELAGDSIVLTDTYIIEPVVTRVQGLIESHPNIKKIRLDNIVGGIVGEDERLGKLIANFDVEVNGDCLSSCAVVAISGSTLTMLDRGEMSSPARLQFHGFFGVRTGQWSPQSLRLLTKISARFGDMRVDAIERALRFSSRANAGLFIISHPERKTQHGDAFVLVCENYPTDCDDLGYRNLDALEIGTYSAKH